MHIENQVGEVIDSIKIERYLSGKIKSMDLSTISINIDKHQKPGRFYAVLSVNNADTTFSKRIPFEIINAEPTLSLDIADSTYELNTYSNVGHGSFSPVGQIISSNTNITPDITIDFLQN